MTNAALLALLRKPEPIRERQENAEGITTERVIGYRSQVIDILTHKPVFVRMGRLGERNGCDAYLVRMERSHTGGPERCRFTVEFRAS